MSDFWFRFLVLSIPALSIFALGYMIGSDEKYDRAVEKLRDKFFKEKK